MTGDKELASRVGTGHFGYTNYLAFNPKVKPFDNPKVRQAISYAIDRSSVVNAAGGSSLAEPATTFLPNQKSFGYTPYDHFPAGETGNAAKAKELLKEAGYTNGLTVTLTHSNAKDFETSPEIATAVQDALKKAGITVKLQGLEDNDYSDKIHSVEDRARLLPRPLGCRLALRRPLPRPDLRRPADRQGRLRTSTPACSTTRRSMTRSTRSTS